VKIPKAQKDIDDLTVFLRFFGSACIKAAYKHVGEIDPSESEDGGILEAALPALVGGVFAVALR